MSKTNKFSPEVRERAVRMVQEHRGEYPSLWAAIESIARPRLATLRRPSTNGSSALRSTLAPGPLSCSWQQTLSTLSAT